ncbi:MAG: hypothetical protein QW039_01270 [Fervidicoccaceae archaeon]
MSHNYIWIDPHRRALEIGPLQDGSFIYFVDMFLQCANMFFREEDIESQLKVQGGISICEIPLPTIDGIDRRVEMLLDEEYRIVQIISLELRSGRRLSANDLIALLKSAEEEIAAKCKHTDSIWMGSNI